MYVEQVPRLMSVCRLSLEKRTKLTGTLDWIDAHPYALIRIVDAFDEVINDFNFSRDLPSYAQNAREVRELLNGRHLDRASSVIKTLQWNSCHSGRKVLGEMNQWMERGETTEEEPCLTFHELPIDPEAKAIGGLFHFYDVAHVMKEPEMEWEPGKLVDALIEVTKTPLLLDALGNPKRLNWINNWEGFDPSFRKKLATFKYADAPIGFPFEPNLHRTRKAAAWPQKVIERIAARLELEASRSHGEDVRAELENNTDWLRKHIELWRGVGNLEAWIKRYDSGCDLPTAIMSEWGFLSAHLRPTRPQSSPTV